MILNNYPLKYLYMVEQCPAISHYYSLRNNHLFTVKSWITKHFAKQCKICNKYSKIKAWLAKKKILQIKQNLNHTTMDKEIQISINFPSNLNADLYDHNLVESSKCSRFGYSYKDSSYLSFIANVIFTYILNMILSFSNGNL